MNIPIQRVAALIAGIGLAAGLHGPASAVAYSCIGPVDRVTVDPAGNVSASFNFGSGVMEWQLVCNLAAEFQGTSAVACKSIFAVLMTAQVTSKPVQMWFDRPVAGQCSATPWQPLKNMGWYWGPALMP